MKIKNLSNLALLFAVVVFYGCQTSTQSDTQAESSKVESETPPVEEEKESTELYGQEIESTRGESEYTLPTEDVPVPEPETTRGTSCCVKFTNYTPYGIYIWVDGKLKGSLDAWENGSVCVYSGYTKVYARTYGSSYDWSANWNCDGDFTFKLDESTAD